MLQRVLRGLGAGIGPRRWVSGGFAIGKVSRFDVEVVSVEEGVQEGARMLGEGGWEGGVKVLGEREGRKLLGSDGGDEGGERGVLDEMGAGEMRYVFVPAHCVVEMSKNGLLGGGGGGVGLIGDGKEVEGEWKGVELEKVVEQLRGEVDETDEGIMRELGSRNKGVQYAPRLPSEEEGVGFEEKLWEICEKGEIGLLLEEIEKGSEGLHCVHPVHGGGLLHAWSGGFVEGVEEARKGVGVLVEDIGLDVNGRAKNGSTPLHWAAGNGNMDAVRALVESGADVFARSYTWNRQVFGKGTGQLPIHWAAESNHHSIVDYFATLNQTTLTALDDRGSTPADAARGEGHFQLATRIQTASSTPLLCLKIQHSYAAATILPQK